MNPEPNVQHVQKEKSEKSRCTQCRKKLGLMEYTCKCKKQFCISHLQPQEHACTFNYKAEADAVLKKQLDAEPRSSTLEKI